MAPLPIPYPITVISLGDVLTPRITCSVVEPVVLQWKLGVLVPKEEEGILDKQRNHRQPLP